MTLDRVPPFVVLTTNESCSFVVAFPFAKAHCFSVARVRIRAFMMSPEKSPKKSGVGDLVRQAHDRLREYLHAPENDKVRNFFEQFEKSTNLKREQLAYFCLGLTSIYFIIGFYAQIICNLVGFAYPAYMSVKAIRTPDKTDDTKWLTYWTVFAFFSLIDFFASVIMCYFPFYWLAKIVFLLYLYLPQTNGALVLYDQYVDNFITTLESRLFNTKTD